MNRTWWRAPAIAAILLLWTGPAMAMYHPAVGRWLQREPREDMGEEGFYQYALSQPTDEADPSGLYVNAIVEEGQAQGERAIWLEAGVVLWGPGTVTDSGTTYHRMDTYEVRRDYAAPDRSLQILRRFPGLLSGVEQAIHLGLARLSLENNPFRLCHTRTGKQYPIKWRAKVQKSQKSHFLSKPGTWHYVEVKRNPLILGLFGPQNSFSPSISTKNNQGGWGAWSYEMGIPSGGQGMDMNDAWWAAHEILHFAGLWDEYSYITGAPGKQYRDAHGESTNTMAGGGSWKLEQWQIERILKDRLSEDPGWELGTDYSIK